MSPKEVLRNREYVGYVIVSASAMIALFVHIATSAFILESVNGLSPLAYSVGYAANSGGMTLAAFASARLAGRVRTRVVVMTGQIFAVAGRLTGLLPMPACAEQQPVLRPRGIPAGALTRVAANIPVPGRARDPV